MDSGLRHFFYRGERKEKSDVWCMMENRLFIGDN